jgi:hypothetical protein
MTQIIEASEQIKTGLGNDFAELGKFLQEHPELADRFYQTQTIVVFLDREDFSMAAKAMGSFDKNVDSAYFEMNKHFGGITLSVNFKRDEVCERVKVGEKVIPEQILPAKSEEVIPEHVEDVYEWKCPASVLAKGKA